MRYRFLFFLSFLLANSVLVSGQDVYPLMPQNGEVGEWLPTGKSENYKTEELFYLINGGADLYLEYGFSEVWATTYENNKEAQIKVEIYAMDADSAAYGIFTMNRVADGEDARMAQLSQKTPYSLAFWQDKYYILLRSSLKDADIQDAMCLMGDKIVQKIKVLGSPPSIIPTDLVLDKDLKYFKGVLGLATIYYFDYSNVFQFSHGYYHKLETGSSIHLHYPNTKALNDGYTNAVSVLSKKSKFVEVETGENTLKLIDKKNKTLKISKHKNFVQIDML